MSASAGEVALYTGNTSWFATKATADAQAQICVDELNAAGIPNTWYRNATDAAALATWMAEATDNGETDVLVLYGYLPGSIYPPGNAMPNGSIVELFLESEDGDAVLNHGDWMFYVSSTNNGAAGLQNIMDVTAATMAGANDTPVVVTELGRQIAPTLADFMTDRPFHLDTLGGEWFVEVALAQDSAGLLADPVIVRDGDRGRLIPVYQTNAQDDPKGLVAAEIVIWLLEERVPTQVSLSGATKMSGATPLRLTIELLDDLGLPTEAVDPVTVDLETSSGAGAFDTDFLGSFDGSVTSVTIPTGEASMRVYYRDNAAGLTTLTADVSGEASAQLEVSVFDDIGAESGEVVIYTGAVNWMTQEMADAQAQICADKLDALGIPYTWLDSPADDGELASWVSGSTDNGETDVLVLYGRLPDTIYPPGNTQPEGSLVELFIESTDGDAVINHGDWIFYKSSTDTTNNAAAGLQNIADIPGIVMNGADNLQVFVTGEGSLIAPSLKSFLTDRQVIVAQLAGDWLVEVSLAENAAGTRIEPCILRDGSRGRLIPIYQAANQDDPKGAVAAEVIAWLYGIDRGGPEQIGISGRAVAMEGSPAKLTLEIQDATGSPSLVGASTTVSLQSSSATGRFDVAPDGTFNGSVTSVTVAAGKASAVFYYKDTTAGTPTLTGSSGALSGGTIEVTIFERSFAPPGEVAIYTGVVAWITKAEADQQAQICSDRLDSAGISNTWFMDPSEDADLEEWVSESTDNGKLDVLILYGRLPDVLYPPANAQPEGSLVELFIESEDGDAIINHADWMFYKSSVDFLSDGTTSANNGAAGLQNIADIPGIVMNGADNSQMVVTPLGSEVAASLADFLTDRPLFTQQLTGNWLVEAAFAQSLDGSMADPVVVRDGSLGRLIPLYQTNAQADPKGAVTAEVVAWLLGSELVPTELGISGRPATVAGSQVKFTVNLQDGSGTLLTAEEDVTLELSSSSASGAFDTTWSGGFGSSTLSVTIPAGETTATFFYKSNSPGLVTLTGSAPGLDSGQFSVNVLGSVPVSEGEVAIYTGVTWWLDKALADAQAQICVNALDAAGIANVWYDDIADEAALASWVMQATDNGEQDVLILYGRLPDSLYPPGNTQVDGSIVELFIESEDGDAILNHGDWLFYKSSTDTTNNGAVGLQTIADIPGIVMNGADNTAVSVTDAGEVIAPTLGDYLTDRPVFLNQLAGDWFVEAALAESPTGTSIEPCILRDGNRGRLIPVYQAMDQNDPKGQVAAEIIQWLMDKATGGGGEPRFHRGDANADGGMNITDGIFVLNYLFLGGPTPTCLEAANGNDDADINITDGIFILNYLFLGGPEPPAPGPTDRACGPDPGGSPTNLGCASYPPCP